MLYSYDPPVMRCYPEVSASMRVVVFAPIRSVLSSPVPSPQRGLRATVPVPRFVQGKRLGRDELVDADGDGQSLP